MKNLTQKVYEAKRNFMEKLIDILMKKEEGDGQVVVAVLLIVVAIILVFLFKDKVTDLMSTVFGTVTTKVSTLLGTI